MEQILRKFANGERLHREDALSLLRIQNLSEDYFKLLSFSNQMSRKAYGKKAYIFLQIGLDTCPCSGNCKFCSLGKDNLTDDQVVEKSLEDVKTQLDSVDLSKIASMFLMSTADYPFETYLEMGREVKLLLPAGVKLVANYGDFQLEQAKALVGAGFDCAYHIVRLREGIDTDIPVERRLATLDAIQQSGLDLYYCIEPIGREHSYEEIAEEMLRAQRYDVDVMAVMARVPVAGTKFEDSPALDEVELAKILAVTRLVVDPKRSMNVHEPKTLPMLAGVNQLYAELGVNPRDRNRETQLNRGRSEQKIEAMLADFGYTQIKDVQS